MAWASHAGTPQKGDQAIQRVSWKDAVVGGVRSARRGRLDDDARSMLSPLTLRLRQRSASGAGKPSHDSQALSLR